jgi:hypothetical protein
LTFVAFSDLGKLGPGQSEQAVVEWHWYDHLPGFSGWALIAALLILVKENRNRQAWSIVILFLLLSEVVWPWGERLFSLSSTTVQIYGDAFQWLVVVWTALWLVSPWLARCRPAVAFLLALIMAATVGALAQYGLDQRLYLGISLLSYAVAAFTLLVAVPLSGLCCRKRYRPGRFMAWLVPWLIAGSVLGLTSEIVWESSRHGQIPSILALLPRFGLIGGCMAGILYLFNLPFMYLAFRSPVYRDRFQKLLRLHDYVSPTALTSDAGVGEEVKMDSSEG